MVLRGSIETALASQGISLQEAVTALEPFVVYVLGVVLYAVFVYRFYHFVGRRDVFELDLVDYARGTEKFGNAVRMGLYGLQYILVFPILLVAWFLVYTFFLSLVGGARSVDSLFVVSMVLVSAIRITSYYTEELSNDLAKSIPFAILGIFIADGVEAIPFEEVFAAAEAIAAHNNLILYYLGFTMALELTLRISTILVTGKVETVTEGEEER